MEGEGDQGGHEATVLGHNVIVRGEKKSPSQSFQHQAFQSPSSRVVQPLASRPEAAEGTGGNTQKGIRSPNTV